MKHEVSDSRKRLTCYSKAELKKHQEYSRMSSMGLCNKSISPSCSENEVSGYVVNRLNAEGPTTSSTVKASCLLKVLRRFHKDHIQLVSQISDGFLGYHVMNKTSLGSNKSFNEMGFVYDSVLSTSYGGSLILEMVRVDFTKVNRKQSGIKRCLSLDDLAIIAEKNDKLDRNTSHLLGVSDDRQCRNLRSVCDGIHFRENVNCKLLRCTTVLQDDHVARKMAVLRDAGGCDEQETVSSPRYSSAEPPRMVDEYYAMEYAEGLFKRCHLDEVWNKLDFVHRKWLGELIDEEHVLVSKYLKNVSLNHKYTYYVDDKSIICSKQSVGLGLYCPNFHSVKSEECVQNSSSLGSLNNMLIEGRPVFNKELNEVKQKLRSTRKINSSLSCKDYTSLESNPQENDESVNNSCEYKCDECTKDGGDVNACSKNHVERTRLGREMDKVWASFKNRIRRPTKRTFLENVSRKMSMDLQRKERRVSGRGARLRRDRLKCASWRHGSGSDESGESRSDEMRGRKSRLSMRKPMKEKRDFFEKDKEEESPESSSSSLTSSVDSKEVQPSPSKTIEEAESEGSNSSSCSTTKVYIEETLAKMQAEASARDNLQEFLTKRLRRSSITNHAGLVQLLCKEANDMLSSGDSFKRPVHVDNDDCFLQLEHFSVFFSENQVQKLLDEGESRPLSMTDKIMKTIEDCKMICLRICNHGPASEGGASSDESVESAQHDVTGPDQVASHHSKDEDETGSSGSPSSSSSWSTALEEENGSSASSPGDSDPPTQPMEELKSVITDEIIEPSRELETLIESMRRHCAHHDEKHPVHLCQKCEAYCHELSRLISPQLLRTLNWEWMNAFRVNRVRPPPEARDTEVSGAGRRAERGDEDRKRSKSESDVRDYLIQAPPKTARKCSSLRRMAIVRGQKKRPNVARGPVYKVNVRPINCRKSVSRLSLPFKRNAADEPKTTSAGALRSALKDASTSTNGD